MRLSIADIRLVGNDRRARREFKKVLLCGARKSIDFRSKGFKNTKLTSFKWIENPGHIGYRLEVEYF